MVTIVDSQLRHTVFETIFDTLTSANLLSSTVTVTASYIDNQPTFPQVVVNPISKSEDERSMGSSAQFTKNIAVVIDVFTKKKEHIDTISDAIETLLKSNDISGLYLSSMDSAEGEGRDSNNQKIHVTSLTFNYMRRGS